MMAACVLAGVTLVITDELGITTTDTNNQDFGNFHVAIVNVSFDPNWWYATLVLVAFVISLVFMVFPAKKLK
jgi:hypothetical protein